jgi:TPR repeat protein
MIDVANCYHYGYGVNKDEHEAFEWYQKAAATGDSMAVCDLAMCYAEGRGVGKNVNQAITLFQKSAASGFIESWNSLGYCYAQNQQYSQAAACYETAALGGSLDGMYNLGCAISPAKVKTSTVNWE